MIVKPHFTFAARQIFHRQNTLAVQVRIKYLLRHLFCYHLTKKHLLRQVLFSANSPFLVGEIRFAGEICADVRVNLLKRLAFFISLNPLGFDFIQDSAVDVTFAEKQAFHR